MQLDQDQRQWLDRTRGEWFRVMQPEARPMGKHLFGEPRWLPDEAVTGAQVFASRVAALNYFPKGGVVGEVGTQTGQFATLILDTCKPDALHLFDLEFDTLRKNSPALEADSRITMHVGDSGDTLGALPDASFDWLYIDGDHFSPGVNRDIAQALRKVKPAGTLVFNDYVVWSPIEMIDYGVVPAVNDLLAGGEWTVAYLALHPLMYCDIALRRV